MQLLLPADYHPLYADWMPLGQRAVIGTVQTKIGPMARVRRLWPSATRKRYLQQPAVSSKLAASSRVGKIFIATYVLSLSVGG